MKAPVYTPRSLKAECEKLLPKYKWRARRTTSPTFMSAEGTISSGFNRLSTLDVDRRPLFSLPNEGLAKAVYCVTIHGYGKGSPQLAIAHAATLKGAISSLRKALERAAHCRLDQATNLNPVNGAAK